MKWINNDALTNVRDDWKGNPIKGGRFQYTDNPFYPSNTKVLQWLLRPNPQRREKQADHWLPEIRIDLQTLKATTGDFICWLGHASFLIRINGVRLLIDPVLFDLPFLPRKAKMPYSLEELGDIDYILLSHDHRDHCDKKSLQAICSATSPKKMLTSLNMKSVVGPWLPGLEIEEAGWYQAYRTAPDIEVIYLPARHWCRRGLFDFNKVLWGSFLIRSPAWSIYFGADSGYGAHFAEIGKLFPEIDLGIIGIGAYKPAFMMEEIHTSPKEAVRAFEDLGVGKMLAMHYGTYDLSDEPISEPYRHTQRIFEESGHSERLLLPAIGEVVRPF